METEIKNAVHAAGKEAWYDEKAKRLLGNKIILAHILVRTIGEFKGMDPKDVMAYIEGEPFISEVPVEPGLTNHPKAGNGQRVLGMNTENTEINEGLVRFDIVFYVRMKDGLSQIIVNVEAQKDAPSKYKILNRAVFYVCRLVSSQKERDFVHMDYDSIKRVYSIWLRLLGTLFSEHMEAGEKLNIMETEYGIPADDDLRKDVGAMCNLSEGILEKGIAKGRIEGRIEGEKKIILNMRNNNFTLEQIALATDKSVEEIESIIETSGSVSV